MRHKGPLDQSTRTPTVTDFSGTINRKANPPYQGSYKKSQPFFQDFSRTKLNFQGLPTMNVISQIVYKMHIPSPSYNRFLRLQEFSPSPSLHLLVHLPFLFISCFYIRILQCLKLLYTGKEYQSLCKAICF